MGKPRFSIVTISFNQDRYLRECIESVLNQSFYDFEYIIVDDGSSDYSRNIINEYRHDKRVRIIFGDKDEGPVSSLKKGFANASGEIYYYINSDDFILKDSLKIISEYFDKNINSDIIFGDGYIVDENSFLKKSCIASTVSLSKFKYGRMIFFQQGHFFRADAYKDVGGFNIENRYTWDSELFLDFYVKNKKFLKINIFLGAFRSYKGTISNLLKEKKTPWNDRLYIKYFGRKKNLLDHFLTKYFYFYDRLLNFKFWLKFIRDFLISKKKIS